MTGQKRRVTVARTSQDSLNKRLEGARMEEALAAQKARLVQEQADQKGELLHQHSKELVDARNAALDDGIDQGKKLAMEDYEAMLDESVNNRLCDNDRNIPWPVGVMIAGEQHRILQALAEWKGSETAQEFGRHLGIIHFPENLDAPSAVTYRNCEEPPKHIERDQKGNQVELEHGDSKLPGYSDHWKYYLRQLEDGTG